jgi:putative addiction module component (TIGR02574 family)
MIDELKKIPVDERIELIEDLWDSIAADQEALRLTPAKRVELDRRPFVAETVALVATEMIVQVQQWQGPVPKSRPTACRRRGLASATANLVD